MNKYVIDIEIRAEVGGELGWDDTDKLGVAFCCVYDYAADRNRVFGGSAEELNELRALLCEADEVSGYNILNFDYPVIFGLSKDEWKVSAVRQQMIPRTNDILRRIWISLGLDPDHFVGKTHGGWRLDDVVRETLNSRGKIANGAQAPIWFQQGELCKVINYCLDDIALERELAEFVDKYHYVISRGGSRVIIQNSTKGI